MDDNGSRLQFHCQNCDLRGARNDSYKFLPGERPAFSDECPRCGSDDLDILDGEKSVIPENRGWDYRKEDGGYGQQQRDEEECEEDFN